jgi:hypothetical protein
MILGVSRAGFLALSMLPHLKEFHFGNRYTISSRKHQNRCILMCANYLPHLKIIGRDFSSSYFMRMRAKGIHNELVQQRQFTKLLLTDLVLGGEAALPPHENLQLPDLQSLSVWLPMRDTVGLCNRFSTITALGLFGPAEADMVMSVLQSVGGRLQTLLLHNVPQPISLSKIFVCCPHLEKFTFCLCNFNDLDFFVQWPEINLSNVEEAHMGQQRPQLGYEPIPRGFIMQVNSSTKITVLK